MITQTFKSGGLLHGNIRPLIIRCKSTTTSISKSSSKYCQQLVKTHDFENFLCGLLFPNEYRDAFYVIRAFNIEVAMIKDHAIGNPLAARVRFQWWRNMIAEMYSGEDSQVFNGQPVAQSLKHIIDKYKLSQSWLDRCFESRASDWSNTGIETLDELEEYAERSQSSLLYLLLETFRVKDEQLEYAASHVGVCSGIVTLLRGTPHHISQHQTYFPRATLLEAGISPEVVISQNMSEQQRKALQDVTYNVASQAFGHLDQARKICKDTPPKEAIFVLLPAIRSSIYFEQLRTANFDVFHPSLILSPRIQLWFQFKLLQSVFMKRLMI